VLGAQNLWKHSRARAARVQDERNRLEQQLQLAQQHINTAKARQRCLRDTHAILWQRVSLPAAHSHASATAAPQMLLPTVRFDPAPCGAGTPHASPAAHATNASGSQSALTPLLNARQDLFHASAFTPPSIESFRCCAAVTYADLLEASGSSTGYPDLSTHRVPALLDDVRNLRAAQNGCSKADVCWFVQGGYRGAAVLQHNPQLARVRGFLRLILSSLLAGACTLCASAGLTRCAP
jgi:hypothetical protein